MEMSLFAEIDAVLNISVNENGDVKYGALEMRIGKRNKMNI